MIAIDKKKMAPIVNSKLILDDIENFLENNNSLKSNSFDLIISDMAPNSSGHRFTDLARSEKVCLLALRFSLKYLVSNGDFICKIFRNSAEKNFLKKVKKYFNLVKTYKPASSRKESKEIYLIAIGFNNLHKD